MRALRLALPLLVLGAAPLAAQKPIQISLFTPVQIVPENQSIRGLRINFIYGRNTAVTGLDIGLVNISTGDKPSSGLQYGLVSMVHGPFTGWQWSFVGSTEGRFQGLQSGFVNLLHESEGVQWGGVNSSWNHNGLQFGLVNYARRIHGVQIGFVNIIKEGGQFPVFPIVNWGK